jgi:ParB-like chromosome segregation protein Spo0J
MSNMSPVIQLWNPADLVPYPGNAKKHSPEQVASLVKLIEKFGWTQPIIVGGDGAIIAGHGRRLAALQMKMTKVPVIVRDDLSQAEVDALRLADNRVSSNDYDQELLSFEINRLFQESGLDLIQAMGFDQKELDFSIIDLGFQNEDFFVEDQNEAVAEQNRQNAESIAETDLGAAPVTDALGFKRVSVAESREIRQLMSAIEGQTGVTGVTALISALRKTATGDQS